MHFKQAVPLAISLLALLTNAVDLDPTVADSIKSVAKTLAGGIIETYKNATSSSSPIGLFNDEYYWWEAGAAWDILVQYQTLTADKEYSDLVGQALQYQKGPNDDYMPPNQTKNEGNDDQSTWALAALTAAEENFPNQIPTTQWLTLATNVFNELADRWDTSTCAGGLRWQIFTFNNGYDYKNSQSNANFFLLAARLAKLTGNATYTDWAEKTYNWTQEVGLLTDEYHVYDGTDATSNCSTVNRIEWTSPFGAFLYGCAVMYNLTNAAPLWTTRVAGFVNATDRFASGKAGTGVLYEPACEPSRCNNDQRAFKAQLASNIARASLEAPFAYEKLMSILSASATALAQGCTAGSNGEVTCLGGASASGTGLGELLSALSIVQGLLVKEVAAQGGNLTLVGQNNNTATPSSTSKGSVSGSPSGTAAPSATGTGLATHFGVGWSFVGAMGLVAGLMGVL